MSSSDTRAATAACLCVPGIWDMDMDMGCGTWHDTIVLDVYRVIPIYFLPSPLFAYCGSPGSR